MQTRRAFRKGSSSCCNCRFTAVGGAARLGRVDRNESSAPSLLRDASVHECRFAVALLYVVDVNFRSAKTASGCS